MGSQEAERKTSMFLLAGFADNLKEMRGFLNKLSVILFFGLLAFPLSAFCQVDTAWVRHYNGVGDKTDEMLSSAVDDSGNSIVTGVSGYNPSTWDFVTIKYDRNGNQLWRQNYMGVQPNHSEPGCLALDKNGNIYVTGGRGASCFTLKYDSNGNRLWEALYSNTAALGKSVTTDEKGNVYVVGMSGYYPDFDFLTLKYDSNGNQRWAMVFSKEQNHSDYSHLITPDKNGSVYVSGYSRNHVTGPAEEWITIKYDSLGNQLWVKSFSTWQGAWWSAPVDMKMDASGNIYLTGGVQDSGTIVSYATIKYDPDGNQLWVARYLGPNPGGAYDFAISLALDSSANVYVTGYSYGNGTDEDIATIKYDSNGNQVWLQRYNGATNGRDEGREVFLDSVGNVYVAGISMGANSAYNFLILKYDSDGIFLWEKRYEGPVNLYGSEIFSIDRNGHLYLSGADTQNAYDFVTIKYSPLPALKGDLNLDGVLTMADVVLMLNFTFNGDPFPAAPTAGDLNCNGAVSAVDFVIMLQIFFLSAPPPC